MAKVIGIRVLTGQICPETGYYLVEGVVGHTRKFEKGRIMPQYAGRNVIWVLYSYEPQQ